MYYTECLPLQILTEELQKHMDTEEYNKFIKKHEKDFKDFEERIDDVNELIYLSNNKKYKDVNFTSVIKKLDSIC